MGRLERRFGVRIHGGWYQCLKEYLFDNNTIDFTIFHIRKFVKRSKNQKLFPEEADIH